MNKRVVVVIPREDEWLFECLEKIVKTKNEMGLRSTMSYELLRLAKNGMTKGMVGADLDRKILRGTPKKTD